VIEKNLCKYESKSQEFALFWRSQEQFDQTEKGKKKLLIPLITYDLRKPLDFIALTKGHNKLVGGTCGPSLPSKAPHLPIRPQQELLVETEKELMPVVC
jgi:hypothetical protein